MLPMLVKCSAASLVLIFVVMAESLTNAPGCERSLSESSSAKATTDPRNAQSVNPAIIYLVFIISPLFGNMSMNPVLDVLSVRQGGGDSLRRIRSVICTLAYAVE